MLLSTVFTIYCTLRSAEEVTLFPAAVTRVQREAKAVQSW